VRSLGPVSATTEDSIPPSAQPSDSQTAHAAHSDESAAADSVEALLQKAVRLLGGTHRAGQAQMAKSVADAIKDGVHLLVQAGTGTGKSLGYLVPALRHALNENERVIISTATLALQRQLMLRDIPLVTQSIGKELGRPAKITLLKGRQNYVCKHKLHGGMPDEPDGLFDMEPAAEEAQEQPSELGAEVMRLRKWAQETQTGDRDDLVPGVSEKAWRQVSVSALECLGAAKCPMAAECFSEQVRSDAQSADVVVTNHAMLALSTTGENSVLPEHEVVIVDEAHDLTQRVTAAVTGELSASAVEAAARTVRRHAGLPTTDLDAGAQSLASALEKTPAGWLQTGLPAETAEAVAAIHNAARELMSIVRADDKPASEQNAQSHKQLAHAALEAIFEVCERLTGLNEHDVAWCTQPSEWNDRKPALHIAPLNVAGLLRNSVLEKRSAIFTSATLKLGGEFSSVAGSIGLQGSQGGNWRGVDVGSPFDYAKQGILYVARHLPRPGEDPDQTHAELRRLISASDGGVLGLFSSRRAAQLAAQVLREICDVPILCQGDDVLPTLVSQFASDAATCLFGTISLWQGVDVPGQNCRVVAIDRIPFPRPDDPVAQARSRAVEAAGGNGFMAVSVNHAALLLAQGTGRLIRSGSDRGVVAVLDSRLATAGYGRYLLNSLPEFWRTTDAQKTQQALKRLAQDM